ncbi:phosphoribosylanthranilate isomerase [Afifella sp. IM 167]|uniref:phosphoribosylanthranilate isomerase n=1 Tax=Afifella sp. IM 167 TaxID=2033586 RepID=UPI001CCF3815|nr:phosphoribosylanthranilate isomerase [Afifella sp. IM 167]MBZ8133603.1 phosphoribosylanthranilate isomerase [Afifella sp. IM 167]
MATEVKICGLNTHEAVEASLAAGADFLGFVFFAKSPRNVGFAEAAALAEAVGDRARKVALTVDASDALIADIVAALGPDFLQLHGAESPQRVREVAERFSLPVVKALGIGSAEDLAVVRQYAGIADRLLLDARPPKSATRPGGNGEVFDWSLLTGFEPGVPWFLSGGLDPKNVAEAVRRTRAPAVDVSSGVESAPGKKDVSRIAAFVAAVRKADSPGSGDTPKDARRAARPVAAL